MFAFLFTFFGKLKTQVDAVYGGWQGDIKNGLAASFHLLITPSDMTTSGSSFPKPQGNFQTFLACQIWPESWHDNF
jgi:hypothetical protein